MARSVDTQQSSGEIDLPIEIDRFPYVVSEYVECLNTIAEIQDGFTDFIELSDELIKYSSICQELGNDVPERIERGYEDNREEAISILSNVQNAIDTLNETEASEFDSSTVEQLSTFTDVADELLTDMQEYLGLVHKLATTDSFEESDYYDLQFLDDKISDTELGNTISSLHESINSKINETLSEIDEKSQWSDRTATRVEICPLCECDTEHRKYSNNQIDVGFEYTRCKNCKAEWVNKSRTAEMINNTEGIENLSLDPAIWTRIRTDDRELSTNIDYYQELSDDLIKKKKTLIFETIPIYLVFLLWSAFSQLFGLMFVGLIVFLTVVIGGVNLLSHRVKS